VLTVRTEVTDRMLIFGERHLQTILAQIRGSLQRTLPSSQPPGSLGRGSCFRSRVRARSGIQTPELRVTHEAEARSPDDHPRSTGRAPSMTFV